MTNSLTEKQEKLIEALGGIFVDTIDKTYVFFRTGERMSMPVIKHFMDLVIPGDNIPIPGVPKDIKGYFHCDYFYFDITINN